MEFLRSGWPFPILLMVLLLAGCAGAEPTGPRPVSPLSLAAYATQTIPVKPTLTAAATELPIPIPTPSAYVIQKGDTLLEIARRFGVSLAELLAVNPGIAPEALSVGQVIQIPAPRTTDSLPSPAVVDLGETVCYPSGGGVYCFVRVGNPGDAWLENVKAQVTLLNAEGRVLASGEALVPLACLGAGQTLPAVIFFPGVKMGLSSGVETLSAVLTAIQSDSARCLPLEIKNQLVAIAWGGLSARVEGQAALAVDAKPVSMVWLAGVAYDAEGNIVGVRRWEWSGALAPGEPLAFRFAVYSAGPPIARVETWAEARP